ncbi:hypothetical protein IQ64_11910 [Streptomyces stelliscabiei]|nr:hypothetical protein IQ64_11910 [Streptomyces stelliscabiei]
MYGELQGFTLVLFRLLRYISHGEIHRLIARQGDDVVVISSRDLQRPCECFSFEYDRVAGPHVGPR